MCPEEQGRRMAGEANRPSDSSEIRSLVVGIRRSVRWGIDLWHPWFGRYLIENIETFPDEPPTYLANHDALQRVG
jgi:hypothetical protein